MPRTCCCCIPVLGGATLIGLIGTLLSLAYMAPLVAYKAKIDPAVFNPIEANIKHLEWGLETGFKDINKKLGLNLTEEDIVSFKDEIVEEYLPTALLADLVATGVYVVICALMVIGVLCDMRGMMIPYLMVQMLFIIVAIIVLLGLTVALFFIKVMMGIVMAAVLLIFSFLLVYYWVSVQQAYVELGNRDYMYSPAPTKPYNGSHNYPSAPQSFQMQACS